VSAHSEWLDSIPTMSDETGTAHYLHLTLDLVVEVTDVDALRAAALDSLRTGEAEDPQDEQRDQINADSSGAVALRWLITSDDVLGLIGKIDQVEPVEAILEVGPSDGILDEPT
jgi:hypothetical protein